MKSNVWQHQQQQRKLCDHHAKMTQCTNENTKYRFPTLKTDKIYIRIWTEEENEEKIEKLTHQHVIQCEKHIWGRN